MLLGGASFNRSEDATREASFFFHELGLPRATQGEYYPTYDDGAIVFLTKQACAIRMTLKSEYPTVPHPLFLRPLLQKTSEYFHIALNPGLRVVPEGYSLDDVFNKLSSNSIRFNNDEIHRFNVHCLFDEGGECNFIPIDPGCVQSINESSKDVKRALAGEDVQGRYFKEIREQFESAWPDSEKQADKSKVRQAWKLCEQAKKEGRLVSDWENPKNSYNRAEVQRYTTQVAQKYQQKLDRSCQMT